jgi:hypothetical protein
VPPVLAWLGSAASGAATRAATARNPIPIRRTNREYAVIIALPE